MRDFIANFVRILGICKDFAANRVNEYELAAGSSMSGMQGRNTAQWDATTSRPLPTGDTAPRKECTITGINSMLAVGYAAIVHDLLSIKDIRWEDHDCRMLGDKGYLSAEVQKNLFEAANITLEVPYRLNQKNWRPPSRTYKRFRKRMETVFSQLDDHLMMLRNDAKHSCGRFTRITGKIAAMTFMQDLNFSNPRPIAQIKYALF